MICLDNDVFSRYASGQSYPAVSEYLSSHRTEPWLLPSIVLFEYLQRYSTHNTIKNERRKAERAVDGIVPVDAEVAEQAANVRARLASAGTSLAVPDLLIAATAREHGYTLATRNRNDFDKRPIRQLMDVDIVQ
jgi:predicted nucleic acid-binding protein